LSVSHAVGGHPSTEGSEEAHRLPRPAHVGAQPSPLIRLLEAAEQQILPILAHPRFRLQAAGVVALTAALLLTVLIPARTIRIAVDGSVQEIESRGNSEVAVVEQAGIELGPGDAVEPAGNDTLVVDRATEAVLRVDGEAFALRTQAETIDEALREAGVELATNDSVLRNDVFVAREAPLAPPASLASTRDAPVDMQAEEQGPVRLEVRRAVPFTIIENGQPLALRSSRESIATALRDVGVRLGPGDAVQPTLDSELTAGVTVHLDHATQLVVTLPTGKAVVYTHSATVGEALAESGLDLPFEYKLEPAADTPVSAGVAVHVIGYSEEQFLETERIERKTVYQADPSLPYGQRRVVQGRDGVHYRRYAVVYQDGAELSRDLAEEWLDPEPVDTVIYYSTADAPAASSAPASAPGGLTGATTMRVYATWYNPASAGRSPSDPAYGITATGVPVDRGIVAVDPSVIPLGTRMYIPGYGYAVAADTGGGIRGQMIDLGYPDGVAVDWSSRWVDIYILGP
jgi:uncharacterized protein YabE (DUF348 family)